MSPVTLATAWSMQFDFVASTIIGARSAEQLDDSLAAFDVTLSDELLKQCDAVHQECLYPMG
jgi:aryl-alcohol dehydrogenase-like predicted oxidoreductase